MNWELIALAAVLAVICLWVINELPDDGWRTVFAIAFACALGTAFFGAFYLLGSSHA